MSISGSPPLISHQLFPCSRAVMTFNVRWCYPCIISVHHHRLCVLYKSICNYWLGLLFPETQRHRGLGLDLDLGVTSTLSSGSEHCGTLLFGSPSPWWLWFVHCVLSITSCVSCKPQPVCTQAGFSLLVIVCAHRRKAINGCHWDAGHQGQNRTTSLLLEQFWWPGMTLEVKSAMKKCKQCLHHDGDSVRAPLVPIEATGPMDLLHLDFTKIEVSGDHEKELKRKPEIVNVLVVTDHFTQHTMAFVTEDMTTHTVARVQYHHYFYIFGTPLCLMTDNDLAFISKVVQELCNLFGVKRVCTSTYHPQSNGAIEQQHQTVIKMIGRLSQDEKANWPKHLPELIQAYNGMRSAIMGYSPHYLLFGYHPRFPIDLNFPHDMKKMHCACRWLCRNAPTMSFWSAQWGMQTKCTWSSSTKTILWPLLQYCGVETRGCCSLEDGQLHGKKKDQEQAELWELYSPASTGPRHSDLWDTGWRWIDSHCSLELTIPPAS